MERGGAVSGYGGAVRAFVFFGLAIGWLCAGLPGSQAQQARPPAEESSVQESRTMYVEARTATWKRRGRTLMDVAPLVRNKVRSAGFQVVPKASDPHVLTLTVDYREERGRQYRFDVYGTDITCRIHLEHSRSGTLLDLTVRESSGDRLLGTPPYVEAVQEFETNPYVYFLGDLVRGRAISGLDTTESLIRGFQWSIEADTEKFDPLSAPHSMASSETGYARLARDNTIDELGRLGDPRAVPLLMTLVRDTDPRVRRLSALALGRIGAAESRSALDRAANSDVDREVREAARAALSRLEPLAGP